MTPAATLAIRCRNVDKSFGTTVALDRFDFDVWDGAMVTLLGPSGCGKTTALRIIAGFEDPEGGTVEIDGQTVTGAKPIPPEGRRVGMVFQEYALFPHMTVAQNVGYGVTDNGAAAVGRALNLVGLSGLEGRYPHELSGGQQQRVALARALAPQPKVILLDEPFSNLDAALRDHVRREIRSILQDAGATAVFVTHDQEEALSTSDLVAVMRNGRVVQVAPPDELYLHPVDAWVGGFIGDADFLTGTASGGIVDTSAGSFPTEHDGPVEVLVRPEFVSIAADEDAAARVVEREFFGHDQLVTVALPDGTQLRARLGPQPIYRPGDPVRIEVSSAASFPRR